MTYRITDILTDIKIQEVRNQLSVDDDWYAITQGFCIYIVQFITVFWQPLQFNHVILEISR